ncbi:MAG: flagellar motor switch protein FliN [Treponema sp.]|nr:flagellar motor switch protein FliN [Treponema sp.]
MSDGAISQDEIDALLSGVAVEGLGGGDSLMGGSSAPSFGGSTLDSATLQKFAGDLSVPLADNLNKMTNAAFSGGTPIVEEIDRERFLAKLPDTVVAVSADFSAGLTGDHLYVLAPELAKKIVGLVNKEDDADLDDMAMSVISEAVSTHTNDEITLLEQTKNIAGIACNPPEAMNSPKTVVRIPQGQFALFSYPLTLNGQGYTLWEAVSKDVADGIARALAPQDTSNTISAADMAALSQPVAQNQPMMGGMGAPMGGMQMPMGQMPVNMPNVQSLQYPPLQGTGGVPEQGNIGLIMDVFMEMTVELGRTKKQIKDILGMGEGTIIELDKLAGEPVDILVNHKPIAKGEVVVIDENFGVRVTEILSPLERISELR